MTFTKLSKEVEAALKILNPERLAPTIPQPHNNKQTAEPIADDANNAEFLIEGVKATKATSAQRSAQLPPATCN